jgi:hypothetical protein
VVALGVQIALFLIGVAVFANYAWHIFSANERDWHEANRGNVVEKRDDD